MASGKLIPADDLAGRRWVVARLSERALPHRWIRLRPSLPLPGLGGLRRAMLGLAEHGFVVFIR